MDQLRYAIRRRHYSIRTERAYVYWVRRFILFNDKKHPKNLGKKEVTEFLTYLAVRQRVAASTQDQALSSLIFLYREVIHHPLQLGPVQRAKKPQNLPTVLTAGQKISTLVCAVSMCATARAKKIASSRWQTRSYLTFRRTSTRSVCNTTKTRRTATPMSGCQMLWQRSIRMDLAVRFSQRQAQP